MQLLMPGKTIQSKCQKLVKTILYEDKNKDNTMLGWTISHIYIS